MLCSFNKFRWLRPVFQNKDDSQHERAPGKIHHSTTRKRLKLEQEVATGSSAQIGGSSGNVMGGSNEGDASADDVVRAAVIVQIKQEPRADPPFSIKTKIDISNRNVII